LTDVGWLLVLLFLVVPILEIYVIVQVGHVIGALPTILLLIAESAIGAWIVKREGGRAWIALKAAVSLGRLPGRELSDAALVLVGGTLLLTPGFVTDVFGFFMVLPITRPLARRMLAWFVARRARKITYRGPGGPYGPVVPGEVVGDEDPGSEGRKGPGRAAGG
jgi:UPF0716 protein FxsA